jgi:hypothetical protein
VLGFRVNLEMHVIHKDPHSHPSNIGNGMEPGLSDHGSMNWAWQQRSLLSSTKSSFSLISSVAADTRDAKDIMSKLVEFALVNVIRTTAAEL